MQVEASHEELRIGRVHLRPCFQLASRTRVLNNNVLLRIISPVVHIVVDDEDSKQVRGCSALDEPYGREGETEDEDVSLNTTRMLEETLLLGIIVLVLFVCVSQHVYNIKGCDIVA